MQFPALLKVPDDAYWYLWTFISIQCMSLISLWNWQINHKVRLFNWTVSLCFLVFFFISKYKNVSLYGLCGWSVLQAWAHQPHASSFSRFSATFWSCPSTLNRQGTRYYSWPMVRAFKVIGKYCYLCFNSNLSVLVSSWLFSFEKKVFPCMAMWWERIPSMGSPAPCLCVLAGFPPWNKH